LLALIVSAGLVASSCSSTDEDETTPPTQSTAENIETAIAPSTAASSREAGSDIGEGSSGGTGSSLGGSSGEPRSAAGDGEEKVNSDDGLDGTETNKVDGGSVRSPSGSQPVPEGTSGDEGLGGSPNGPQPTTEGDNTEEDTEEVSSRSPNRPQPVVGGDEGFESEPETVRILHECDVDLFNCEIFADTDSFDQKLPCSQQLTVSDEVVRQRAEAMTQEIATGVRGITQKQAEALAMGLAVCEAEFSEITDLARQGNVGIQFIKLVMGFMSGNYRDFTAAYYRLPCMVAPYEFSIQIMTPSRLRRLISAVREAALLLYKPTNQQITNINQELALPEVTTNLLTEVYQTYIELFMRDAWGNYDPWGSPGSGFLNQVPCGNFLRAFPDLYDTENPFLEDHHYWIVRWDFLRRSPGPYY